MIIYACTYNQTLSPATQQQKYKNQKITGPFSIINLQKSYILKSTRISTSNMYLLRVLFWIHESHYIHCAMYVSKKFGIIGFKTIFGSLYVESKSVSHLLKLWMEVFMLLKFNILTDVMKSSYLPMPSFT